MVKNKSESEEDLSQLFAEVLQTLEEAPKIDHLEGEQDLDAMIEQMEKSLEEIRASAEDLYEQTGMSQEELESFAANPDNFTPDEWALLSQIQEKVETIKHTTEGIAEGEPIAKPPKGTRKLKGKKKPPKRKKWLQG